MTRMGTPRDNDGGDGTGGENGPPHALHGIRRKSFALRAASRAIASMLRQIAREIALKTAASSAGSAGAHRRRRCALEGQKTLSLASLTRLAPESDLRTVMVRRPQKSEERADDPDGSGLFFSKGAATASGFRPAFWTYDSGPVQKPRLVVAHPAEKAEDRPADLARIEAEFIEMHRRLLEQPSAFVDDDAPSEEATERSGGGALPPEADLRSIEIRPRRQGTHGAQATLEDLFAKKNERPAASAAASEEAALDAAAPVAMPEPALARAPKPPAPPTGPGVRITLLACICAALAVIFAARWAHEITEKDAAPPAATIAAAAPVAVPPAAAPAPVAPTPNPAAEALIAEGNHDLAMHDIMSARLCFERAAEKGSGQAALLAGMTFDPIFLAQAGVYGFKGDETEAQSWYRRARDLGDPDAAKFLPQGAAH